MMASSGHKYVVLDEDDRIYEKGDVFKSFHHQASEHVSQKALLAGFLSTWFKKCVVPSPLHDGIMLLVLFPDV